VLIITGQTDLPFHDWKESTPVLRGILERTGKFEVRISEEPRGITSAALAGYDAILVHYNGPRWGREAEKAVEEFVRGGKGMISLHQVGYGTFFGMEFNKKWTPSVSDPLGWEFFPAMFGGRWRKIGHAPRHVFNVEWTAKEHPIARGLEPTFVANDELYNRLELNSDARVIAAAYDDPKEGGAGATEPIVWTVDFGKGRTLHTTLGHDPSAMHQPGFAAVLARGTEWVATGGVSGEAPAAEPQPLRVLVYTGSTVRPTALYALFEGHSGVVWDHSTSASTAFCAGMKDRYDVAVLWELPEKLNQAQRSALEEFARKKGGIVAVGRASAANASWPWWNQHGMGVRLASAERQGPVAFTIRPVPKFLRHPVVLRVGTIPVRETAPSFAWLSPEIRPLMLAGDAPAVFLGPDPEMRIVGIAAGSAEETLRHPAYRKLMRNALLWAGGRVQEQQISSRKTAK
jgi:type 1 glutamine amidotransferase